MSNKNKIVTFNPLLNYPSLSLNDIELNTSISPNDKSLLLASYNYPKIKTIEDDEEVQNKLIEIIGICIWESGFNIEKKDQKLLINYMIDIITKEYSYLTLEEIKLAFLNGVRGKFGEYMGISIRTFNMWLDYYISEEKSKVIRLLSDIEKEKKPKEVTEEIKKFWRCIWLINCISGFNAYKQSGTLYSDINNELYQYIRYEMKLVDLTPIEVNKIWKKANIEYKRDHSLENAKNYSQRILFKSILEKLERVDTSEDENIKIKARKISLYKLFDKIINLNIDFKESIIKHENLDIFQFAKEFYDKNKKKD